MKSIVAFFETIKHIVIEIQMLRAREYLRRHSLGKMNHC